LGYLLFFSRVTVSLFSNENVKHFLNMYQMCKIPQNTNRIVI